MRKYRLELGTEGGETFACIVPTDDANGHVYTVSDVDAMLRSSDLAYSISKLIHNSCSDVPHDIGLKVMELVRDTFNGESSR